MVEITSSHHVLVVWLITTLLVVHRCSLAPLAAAEYISHDIDDTNDTSYMAAAVQYSPVTSSGPANKTIQANLNELELLISSSRQRGAQIVVLSEGSTGMYSALGRGRNAMLSFCEPVNNGTTPCDAADATQQVQSFSCMARRYNIVIVAHMCDVIPCTPGTGTPSCPNDGRFQYNVQVAFNEHGTIIAKYHKSHLFGETKALDQPAPVPVWFDTSFGIRFGMIICFDIEFDEPVRSLLQQGLRHFVYSSSWANYAPAFIATQFQQGFSRITSSNLIAANTGNAPSSFGGGLYSSGDPVNVYFNTSDFAVRIALVAPLPAKPLLPVASSSPVSMMSSVSHKRTNVVPCRLRDMAVDEIGNCYLFNPANTSIVKDAMVSHNGLDCSGQMMATTGTPDETFALMAFKGTRHFNYTIDKLQTEMCLFLRCQYNDSQQPAICRAIRSSSSSTWHQIAITAQHLSPELTTLPFYAVDDGQLRPTSELGMKTSDGGTTAQIWTTPLMSPSTRIYSIAVYNVGKSPVAASIIDGMSSSHMETW